VAGEAFDVTEDGTAGGEVSIERRLKVKEA
jgi:hypothetical protein